MFRALNVILFYINWNERLIQFIPDYLSDQQTSSHLFWDGDRKGVILYEMIAYFRSRDVSLIEKFNSLHDKKLYSQTISGALVKYFLSI